MPETFFPITSAHHAQFGNRSARELRADADDATGPAQLWLAELAEQLDNANAESLQDVPAGWGWTITVPSSAEKPAPIWRKKHGNRPPALLRVLRAATQAAWSDAAAARIADLGNALERDGFRCLNEAPDDWYWITGGRP